ncbi:RPS13 [Symbiodinium sp. KB8]|nr:RPS13 [Symbiodinium sp. KB8]
MADVPLRGAGHLQGLASFVATASAKWGFLEEELKAARSAAHSCVALVPIALCAKNVLSIAFGLGLAALLDGMPGVRRCLDIRRSLRVFPVAACFCTAQMANASDAFEMSVGSETGSVDGRGGVRGEGGVGAEGSEGGEGVWVVEAVWVAASWPFHQPPLCSAGHGDPGEYERWVKRTITSEFVTWVKNGETGLNNYVDHGRPGGDGRLGFAKITSAPIHNADYLGWKVKFDMEKGGYIKPTGKALNASEKSTFARYQRRHVVRCRAGDLADKLTRMVDKYLPRVATQSRVYIMRFPETIPKLLKREHDDEQESIPDWGDDVANDDIDNEEDTPTATTAAHVAEGDDLATMWPWGTEADPQTEGKVLGCSPNDPTCLPHPEGGVRTGGAHSSKLCKWSKRIWRNNVESGGDFDKN